MDKIIKNLYILQLLQYCDDSGYYCGAFLTEEEAKDYVKNMPLEYISKIVNYDIEYHSDIVKIITPKWELTWDNGFDTTLNFLDTEGILRDLGITLKIILIKFNPKDY